VRRALLALAASCAAVIVCYLAFAVPASWFPSAPVKQWGVRDLTLPRGTGGVASNELVVAGADAGGQIYVAVVTDLRARDYASIAWNARDVPADADVHFLWRTDYAPRKIFSMPVTVEAGHLLPVIVANDAGWLGHVTGIGLAFRGAFAQPFAISGVAAKPSGAVGILKDRAREWIAFERWSGTSINTIVGGDDTQSLPLPFLLALSLALAGGAMLAWRRWRPAAGTLDVAAAIAIMFAASWFVLDARWTLNLARQAGATIAQYGGKSWHDKHLAAEDGALFEFVDHVRTQLPP